MNIYFDPEKFGLEIVGEVEWSDECYQFDKTVVWRDPQSQALFVASDSGCSCPSPFESHGRDTLTPISRTQDLIDYFEQAKRESFWYDPGDEYSDSARIDGAIGELIYKASDARPAAA